MFSIMTIASSTTKPTEIVSAISEMLSRLKPATYMTENVASSDNGTAKLGITVAHSRAGYLSTVQHQIDMDRGRDRLLKFRHQRLDRVDQRDGIGARCLLDRDTLCREIVEPSADTGVLHRVDGLADVLEPHWRAVAIGDDQVSVCRCVEELVIGLDRDQLVLAFYRTFR